MGDPKACCLQARLSPAWWRSRNLLPQANTTLCCLFYLVCPCKIYSQPHLTSLIFPLNPPPKTSFSIQSGNVWSESRTLVRGTRGSESPPLESKHYSFPGDAIVFLIISPRHMDRQRGGRGRGEGWGTFPQKKWVIPRRCGGQRCLHPVSLYIRVGGISVYLQICVCGPVGWVFGTEREKNVYVFPLWLMPEWDHRGCCCCCCCRWDAFVSAEGQQWLSGIENLTLIKVSHSFGMLDWHHCWHSYLKPDMSKAHEIPFS